MCKSQCILYFVDTTQNKLPVESTKFVLILSISSKLDELLKVKGVGSITSKTWGLPVTRQLFAAEAWPKTWLVNKYSDITWLRSTLPLKLHEGGVQRAVLPTVTIKFTDYSNRSASGRMMSW